MSFLDKEMEGVTNPTPPWTSDRSGKSLPSCVSLKSNQSMELPIEFKNNPVKDSGKSLPSCVSLKSNQSMELPIEFKNNPVKDRVQLKISEPVVDNNADLNSIFLLLEENVVAFVRNELQRVLKSLTVDDSATAEEAMACEDEEQRTSREALTKIMIQFLRRMKHENLADMLHNKTQLTSCKRKLKSHLREKSRCVFEGLAQAGTPTFLDHIYTELHITEEQSSHINHTSTLNETASWKSEGPETTMRCQDIFTSPIGRERQVRTVVTQGIAGIGKTLLTQKFALDWAEDKTNHEVDFLFPLSFRELNLVRGRTFSLVELLHQFFIEIKEAGIRSFEGFGTVFVFDGLDECLLPLDFQNNEICTDVTVSTSLDVLLTNLIKGRLLPHACLWITTRPAAANQIPPECVDMVTAVQGFTDPQKEEYFRRRFSSVGRPARMISYIKTSQSLDIMCRIPVFCWITASVLEDAVRAPGTLALSNTLTEMYIHFLVVQIKMANLKFYGKSHIDPTWNKEVQKMILALGRLAFDQLDKGKLIFYEEDLMESGIDIKQASMYSGLFSQIFKRERRLNQDKVFSFLHQNLQEFLAALFVYLTFTSTGVNLLKEKHSSHLHPASITITKSKLKSLYKDALRKAMLSQNRHLDIFIQFLLGLSLESNQQLVRGLAKKTPNQLQVKAELVQLIKENIRANPTPEQGILLFHCLNELGDHSLVDEIQQYLMSGRLLPETLSPAHWAALVFILLSSGKGIEVFDLRKFSASEEALLRLLPVVKVSKKCLLSGCNLTLRSCEALATALLSKTSSLQELDLSNNDLEDTGVKLLSAALGDPHCTLQILRLSGCRVTDVGCGHLATALQFNPSHLRELDLSYNHLEEGARLLSAGLEDPSLRLDTLRVDHSGTCRMLPSPFRYACKPSLDPNTANRNLCLSEDLSRVSMMREEQPYPDHPDRFLHWNQLLCSDAMTGRGYWEVHWGGGASVGVSYRGIGRTGDESDCCIGMNDQSWRLSCSSKGFAAWHNGTATDIDTQPCSDTGRVGVFLDWPAGALSFYDVSSDAPVLLHTFHTTFSEPLYPGFGFGVWQGFGSEGFDSFVSL